MNTIPKQLYITYKSAHKVPERIWSQYEKFAPTYKLNFFDDRKCFEYLVDFSRRYPSINADIHNIYASHPLGPHKADIWRYGILYEMGGIYFDIKPPPIPNSKKFLIFLNFT